MDCRHFVKNVKNLPWNAITVEPIMFLYALAAGLSGPTNSALLYQKVCLNLYDDNICDNLLADGNEDYLENTQKMTSKWSFYENIVYTLPALLAVALYGSWSDRFSRKMPLIIVPIGSILVTLNYLINSIYLDSSVAFLLVGSFVYGVTGGFTVILMAVFSYLSESSKSERRTSRISIVYASQTLAFALSSFLSGVILENTGYIFVYSLTLAFHVSTLVYIVIRIKDITPSDRQNTATSVDETNQQKEIPLKDLPWKMRFKELLSLDNFKQSFMVTFRVREGRIRQCILILVGIAFLYIFTSAGGTFYLFVRHPPLSFSQELYGYYSGCSSLIHFTALAFLIPLLKGCHMKDQLLLVIACISDILGRLYLASCRRAWMVFLTPAVTYMATATFTCIRGLMSTMVRPDELGKIFAVVAWLESLSGLFGSLLYSDLLYPATVDIYPGLVYIISAVLGIIPLSLTIWLFHILRKQGQPPMLQEEMAVTDTATPAEQANDIIDKLQSVDTDNTATYY